MQLPIFVLFSADSFETNELGVEQVKSNPVFEQAIFEGQKFVLVFTSEAEADRHIELHRHLRKLRAAPINTPHEFVSYFGQLAKDGVTAIISDFTNRKSRGFFDLQSELDEMRKAVADDIRRQ